MTRELTRREAVAGIGSAVAFGVGASTTSGAPDADADADPDTDADIIEADLEAENDYRKCVYKRTDDDGEWGVSMPINVHVRVPGDRPALAAVEAEFGCLSGLEWTQLFPDSPARAWDAERAELVGPALSVRRPRLGDEWNHVYGWPVDADRVAMHAHLDVLDFSSSHLHRGDYYRDAAREVSEQFTGSRWDRVEPDDIDYGVESSRLEHWEATGDRKLAFAVD